MGGGRGKRGMGTEEGKRSYWEQNQDLREQGWQSMVVGLRTGDRKAIERAREKFKQANAVLDKVEKWSKETKETKEKLERTK